ncbi:MAG: hypothetical protein JKY56_16300 [Kofleriaceae bacterium]|nr:hypothetical protein [Kofleriaceae bacterium]
MSTTIISTLEDALSQNEFACRLLPILCQTTGLSSSGYPYLQRPAWEEFRDSIPHILSMGERTFAACAAVRDALPEEESAEKENILRACKVVDQIVGTAAITAPPGLWLARHLLGCYKSLGILDRLLQGQAIYPENCSVTIARVEKKLCADELNTDFLFFLSLGFVEQYDESYRIAGHPRVRRIFESILPQPQSPDPARSWLRLFQGKELETSEKEELLEIGFGVGTREGDQQSHWLPTLFEIELGFRLVPLVIAMRAAGLSEQIQQGQELTATELSKASPVCATGALEILTAAGWCERNGDSYKVTRLGERGLTKGPGPFGIIHTYHPYMTQAAELLLDGSDSVWVERGENVAASQDANRGTFERANNALDLFTKNTDFHLGVFIEHAIGKGEATRQRYERCGDKEIQYVGADLEDAAIDAALEEQTAGHLPPDMLFVRRADIGKPALLLEAMSKAGIDPRGAVMVVGNGFHEIRNQTDESMKQVFKGYCDAGILLLFTEENALAIDDIRQTAWNTYHAAFKYVHEKSGQGLRPALPRAGVRLGRGLRAAWSECAEGGGYFRADTYCERTRTIYPYPPKNGINPSISVNHFFVPMTLAKTLGICDPS